MAVVVENLDALVATCKELDERLGKSSPAPAPAPGHELLHPALVEVLRAPASAWKAQGIDMRQVREFTERAKSRGFRKKALIFGAHPKGHTYWAVPLYHGDTVEILRFDRHNGLAQTELTLEQFVDAVHEDVRHTLEKLDTVQQVPASRTAEEVAAAPPEIQKPKMRTVRVELPETDGATITAGDRTETFSGEELGYLIWSLQALQLLTDEEAPDLSSWEHRALRRGRLESVPGPGDAGYESYRETWLRISRRDRIQAHPDGIVAGYKLLASGEWLLGETERDMLRRNQKAKAPRHRPNKEQAAIWKRFVAICDADEVCITVN
ncbi:MAG: hypothetical protein EP330_27645 [Deltaproteobacteria bacterium]|nr:MAG: hypothetical protein EP330_27645 [Deltaproteobacteria bacterium]